MRTVASLALLASAQALMVNVTCPDTPNSYSINGVANANLTVSVGESIWFNIDCAGDPFQITNSSWDPFIQAVYPTTSVSNGTLQLNTSASTPGMLGYAADSSAADTMRGWITLRAATPVVTTVTQVQGFPDLNITWTAGAAGACIFDSWNVLFAAGGVVPGCGNLTNISTVSCRASLNGSTSYSFTVQRVCTNAIANSNVSIASNSQTTVSMVGVKICQGGSVCNCGNATTCTCQLVDVCNCQNAGTCVCQGGTCNGGNAGTLICNFPTGCNKQCAKSCPICIGDTISGFFGSDSCSDASFIQASLALVAALFAFSW